MSAAKILDKLSRTKQTRPGSWMAACPCCESRRGRPLAISETSDGRVLIYAFCGCTTEDVLGRIDLDISDLFDKPLAVQLPPMSFRVPASDVLASLAHEATVLAFVAADVAESREIPQETWERIATAAIRIANAADFCNSR